MGRACSVYGEKRGYERFWWENLGERNHLEDPGVDGRIMLSWIFRKLEGVVGTGWSCFSIGSGGGHLWGGTFGFHKCEKFLE
jgi:hypothetical protein